jgi:hypothetical protein
MDDRCGIIHRMILLIERELRLQGFNVEVEIAKLLEKIRVPPKEKSHE